METETLSCGMDNPNRLLRLKHTLRRAQAGVSLRKFRFADPDHVDEIDRRWDQREINAYREAAAILEAARQEVTKPGSTSLAIKEGAGVDMGELSYLLQKKDAEKWDSSLDGAEVVRLKGDGKYALHIRINRPDFRAYRWASGAGLARLISRLKSDVDFLLITNFRPADHGPDNVEIPRSKSVNEEGFRKIPSELRGLLNTNRIGAYWMIGHWTEKDSQTGEITDNLEYSWLFTKDDPSVTDEEWMMAGKVLAHAYEQTSFIIRIDGEMTQRNQEGHIQRTLTTANAVEDAWKNLAELRATIDREPYGYSEMRKLRERGRRQPLTFPEVKGVAQTKDASYSPYRVAGDGSEHPFAFYLAIPDNNSAHMHFAAQGINYQLP